MSILETARILERATAVLNQLRTSGSWTASLDRASADVSPLFVASIDSLESRTGKRTGVSDYFIVSIRRGSEISARFAHDAETGDFLEAEGVRRPGAMLTAYVDAAEVVRSRLHLPPVTAVQPPADLATPDVVWRPCRQSTSRFLPFWRFRIESRTIYVRADGVMFDELTTTGRG